MRKKLHKNQGALFEQDEPDPVFEKPKIAITPQQEELQKKVINCYRCGGLIEYDATDEDHLSTMNVKMGSWQRMETRILKNRKRCMVLRKQCGRSLIKKDIMKKGDTIP